MAAGGSDEAFVHMEHPVVLFELPRTELHVMRSNLVPFSYRS